MWQQVIDDLFQINKIRNVVARNTVDEIGILFITHTRGLEPVRYGGVLLSAPLHASTTLYTIC
jgi:hypothetical protein